MNQVEQTKRDILDNLHYYLCSRDFNNNFDQSIENINRNMQEDEIETEIKDLTDIKKQKQS